MMVLMLKVGWIVTYGLCTRSTLCLILTEVLRFLITRVSEMKLASCYCFSELMLFVCLDACWIQNLIQGSDSHVKYRSAFATVLTLLV